MRQMPFRFRCHTSLTGPNRFMARTLPVVDVQFDRHMSISVGWAEACSCGTHVSSSDRLAHSLQAICCVA